MIQELQVVEGQFVTSNQVLAVLDDRVAQSAVVVAKAAAEQTGHVASALAEVVFASQQLHRLEALQGSGGISLHEIDNGRLTYDKALANLKTARSEAKLAISKLQLEETRLETHRIRAPFDGQIVRLQLTQGQRVQDDTALMELVNVSTLVAELYVPTKLYDQLVIGNSYELQADIPVNQRVRAVLTTREPIVDAGTQTFRCQFEIDNPGSKFPAGFVVRVDHLVTGNTAARQLTSRN